MLSEYITSLADVSFRIVASMYVRFRYSGRNPMRFAVFWRIFVRFCGFRTPLTPPSMMIMTYLLLILTWIILFILTGSNESQCPFTYWQTFKLLPAWACYKSNWCLHCCHTPLPRCLYWRNPPCSNVFLEPKVWFTFAYSYGVTGV